MARTKKSKPEDNSYKQLTDYINQLSNGHVNWPMVAATIKRYTKDGMTYGGIRYALWYMVNIKEIQWECLGLTPYYYDEAKQYWNDMQKIKKSWAYSQYCPKYTVITMKEHDDMEGIFE